MTLTACPLTAATKQRAPDVSQQGTASAAARRSAIASIPFDKLDEQARAKVNSVLSNITVYRRLPVRVVECDPSLYLFVVRHPDVIVNIWETLGIADLRLRQISENRYQVAETDGTTATIEILHGNHDTHLAYGEWTYTGPLLAKKINGRFLAVLKTGYVREPDGRYYVSSRLDGFLSVEPGGVELLTKTLHPLVVKNADINFIQTVAFVGSVSRTAEVNNHGMQRLVARLNGLAPEVRRQFSEVVDETGQRAAAMRAYQELSASGGSTEMASRPDATRQR